MRYAVDISMEGVIRLLVIFVPVLWCQRKCWYYADLADKHRRPDASPPRWWRGIGDIRTPDMYTDLGNHYRKKAEIFGALLPFVWILLCGLVLMLIDGSR